jgi:hypothetical protein
MTEPDASDKTWCRNRPGRSTARGDVVRDPGPGADFRRAIHCGPPAGARDYRIIRLQRPAGTSTWPPGSIGRPSL